MEMMTDHGDQAAAGGGVGARTAASPDGEGSAGAPAVEGSGE